MRTLATLVLGVMATGVATAQAGKLTLLPTGFLPTDVDDYGRVVGTSPQGPFFRNEKGIITLIPDASSVTPPKIDSNGSILAAYAKAGVLLQAGIYNPSSGWTLLGGLGGVGPQGQLSEGLGYWPGGMGGRAWPLTGGPSVAVIQDNTSLTALPNTVLEKNAAAVATDSESPLFVNLTAGWQEQGDGFKQGAVWIGDTQTLILNGQGERCGAATQLVAAGTDEWYYAIGENAGDGRPWIKLPGQPNADSFGAIPRPGWIGVAIDWKANAIGEGQVNYIIGAYSGPSGVYTDPFVWPLFGETIDLQSFAIDRGVSYPAGLAFQEPRGVGGLFPDSVIVGVGTLDGEAVGWIMHVNYCPQSEYTDCNVDCQLNIEDFICYQTRFALGDPFADCDGDGKLTVDDFVCFYTCFFIC